MSSTSQAICHRCSLEYLGVSPHQESCLVAFGPGCFVFFSAKRPSLQPKTLNSSGKSKTGLTKVPLAAFWKLRKVLENLQLQPCKISRIPCWVSQHHSWGMNHLHKTRKELRKAAPNVSGTLSCDFFFLKHVFVFTVLECFTLFFVAQEVLLLQHSVFPAGFQVVLLHFQF